MTKRLCTNFKHPALFARGIALSVVAAVSASCRDTSAPEPRGLTGNWGSKNSTYAEFALIEKSGQITGHGWSSGAHGVQITGTLSGTDVLLAFTSPPFGSTGSFRGSFVNEALVGDIDGSERVSLVRVDTVAEALAHMIFSTRYPSGNARAVFDIQADTLNIRLGIIAPLKILHVGARIAPGTYSIAASPSPLRAAMDVGSGIELEVFHAVSGILVITHSSQRVLIGSYSMDMVLGAQHIAASGTFSAACSYGYAISEYGCPLDK